MHRILVSPSAERDLLAILRWTHEQFGEAARVRYEALLVQAIHDLADSPERAGSAPRTELGADARVYHLTNSRRRVPRGAGTVRRPRHFLLYRVRDDQLQIVRVLHDSMDPASRIEIED